MSIVYEPNVLLKKLFPNSRLQRLLNKGGTFRKKAFAFLEAFDFIDKESVTRVALKAGKGYEARIAALPSDKKASILGQIKSDPKLLINRVQSEVVTQVVGEIRNSYSGESYEWLPSDAEEPDPEHQLNYGKIFQVGVGEMPGDRYGCKCGMRILVDETELNLNN